MEVFKSLQMLWTEDDTCSQEGIYPVCTSIQSMDTMSMVLVTGTRDCSIKGPSSKLLPLMDAYVK